MSLSPNTPLLSLIGIKKYFPIRKGLLNQQLGTIKALDGIDLTVFAGETLGLVGESGCGKSTLARIILQLELPTAGEIQFNGIDILTCPAQTLKSLRRDLQIVFQNPYTSLDPRMTVAQSITEPLSIHKLAKPKDLRVRAEQMLCLVGLKPEMGKRYPHEFSGGQRQRIGIARALSTYPKLIIADEPVSALDVSVQAQILNLLCDLREKLKLTYIFIAHNLSVVQYISHRIAVMYLGKIVESGPTNLVYNQPLHPYTQALIQAALTPNPQANHKSNYVLPGEPPNPTNPPVGCRFHTRCPIAQARCQSDEPQLREIEPDHWSACHYAETLLTN